MRKVSVLLVSGDRLLSDLIKKTLESTGCDVQVAEASTGAEMAIAGQPDLVILDSELTGETPLLERLSSMSPSPQVIALVGSDNARDEIRSKGFGTVDKRAGLTALVEAIQSSLGIEIPVSEEIARILVVDDEAATLYMVSEFLTIRGYGVTTAQDGELALDAVDRDPAIKVVLLDVIMPKMGGIETLKRIMQRKPHPTVIMMTVLPDQEIAREAVQLGAFDYILKPLDLSALEAIISAGVSHFDYRTRSIWKNLFESS